MRARIIGLAAAGLIAVVLPTPAVGVDTPRITLPITAVTVAGTVASVSYQLPNACPWDHAVRVTRDTTEPTTVVIEANGQVKATMEQPACAQVIRDVTTQVDLGAGPVSMIVDATGHRWWAKPAAAYLRWTVTPSRTAITVAASYSTSPRPASYKVTLTNVRTQKAVSRTFTAGKASFTGLRPGTKYRVQVVSAFPGSMPSTVTATKTVTTRR